jgi:hypothetical protein
MDMWITLRVAHMLTAPTATIPVFVILKKRKKAGIKHGAKGS